MAYFNHAFHKVFMGTGNGTANVPVFPDGSPVTMVRGFINDTGLPTSALSQPHVGGSGNSYFGVFNANTYLSIAPGDPLSTCCPFIIASTPIFQNDKIGPFAGGYRESNKSKLINPRYVRQFYYVAPCVPQQSVVSIGTTPGTLAGGVFGDDTACDALAAGDINANNFQGGTGCAGCCKEYLCGETYYLRIDIKGSPALRFLNHQAYQTVSAYTGCCAGPAPTVVDPTTVYIQWAQAIFINPYIKDLVLPVVFDYEGNPWYAPGTTLDVISGLAIPTHLPAAGGPAIPNTWDTYAASQIAADWTDALPCSAGMRLFGAYVETKFGDCTFQVTDFFEKEPVKILASMVDYTGDPCTFEGVCVYTECYGVQGMGFGEQVLRDLIVSESYLQNYFGSGMDFRIREITQGYDLTNAVDRDGLYGRYYLLHSVPRFNNPTGVFDNDQYMLEIIVGPLDPITNPNPAIDAFEDVINNLLTNCNDCIAPTGPVECNPCEVLPNVPQP